MFVTNFFGSCYHLVTKTPPLQSFLKISLVTIVAYTWLLLRYWQVFSTYSTFCILLFYIPIPIKTINKQQIESLLS